MPTNKSTTTSLLENSVEALKFGISNMDGIELDLRMCTDGELVLHHDTTLMIDNPVQNGYKKWTENNSSDDLKKAGFFKLDDLLSDSDFSNLWTDSSKLVCFEIKLPHPRSGLAGGWRRGKSAFNYVKKMCNKLSIQIEEKDLTASNSIIFSFYPKISQAAKSSGTKILTAKLEPHVRQWGTSNIQRLVALPGFASSTLSSLARSAHRRESPIIGCGIEYFTFPTNKVRFGRSVALHGTGLERLTRYRSGYPIFVWPSPLELEHSMLNAGITCISDNVGDEISTLPTGELRWQRPATQPINEEYQMIFKDAEKTNHASIIKEAETNLPSWQELSRSEKIAQLELWKKDGYWSKDSNLMLDKSNENIIPWEVVRMIAHRGAGISRRH